MTRETTYAVYSLEDGGWAWVFELPDGAAVSGTAESEQQAMQEAESFIRDWYAAAH